MKTSDSTIKRDSTETRPPIHETFRKSSVTQPSSEPKFTLKTIFHPADFSEDDQGAFEHALKLAVLTGAELTLLHVGSHPDRVRWSDFPHVRETLERWKVIPPASSPRELAKLGLRVEKIKKAGQDPVRATLDYVADHKPGLIVLSTHQRHGLDRWFHKTLAEPMARGSLLCVVGTAKAQANEARFKTIVTLFAAIRPVSPEPSAHGTPAQHRLTAYATHAN